MCACVSAGVHGCVHEYMGVCGGLYACTCMWMRVMFSLSLSCRWTQGFACGPSKVAFSTETQCRWTSSASCYGDLGLPPCSRRRTCRCASPIPWPGHEAASPPPPPPTGSLLPLLPLLQTIKRDMKRYQLMFEQRDRTTRTKASRVSPAPSHT